MEWSELFLVFAVCHLVGDFGSQTDWQARFKHQGLGPDPERRRALASHVLVYGACFLPAYVWIGAEEGVGLAVLAFVLVVVPHAIQDDGRLLRAYSLRFKKYEPRDLPVVALFVDQTFHAVALILLALLVAA